MQREQTFTTGSFWAEKILCAADQMFFEGMGCSIRATLQASILSGNHFHTDAV